MTFKRAAKKVKLAAAQARRKKDALVFMDLGCVELDEHIKAQNIALQTRFPSRHVDIDW